jgi:hypothetical protein
MAASESGAYRCDHKATKHAVGLLVSKHLDQPVGLVVGAGAAVGSEAEDTLGVLNSL